MHGVQVVEDDGRLGIARGEGRGYRRGHRHLVRHCRRRLAEHLPESGDGGTHTRLTSRGRGIHEQWLIQADLEPVISPDQPIELWILLPERQRVGLLLHQLHRLRL